MTLLQKCITEIEWKTSYENYRGWEMAVSEYLEDNDIQLYPGEKDSLYEKLSTYVRGEKLKKLLKKLKGRPTDDSNDVQIEDDVWADDLS